MGVIIDTSVLIAAEHGRFALASMIEATPAGDYMMSSISASELLLGTHLLRDPAARARMSAAVESILSLLPVLPFGAVEARLHAHLVATLRRRGQLIGAHDMLIAATALAGRHALATLDVSDFARVPGLRLVDTAPFVLA